MNHDDEDQDFWDQKKERKHKPLKADPDDEPQKEKRKFKRWQRKNNKDFRCGHCLQMVFEEAAVGTKQRNHCNLCLWSSHVDNKPGDRASECKSRMEPIALTFKQKGWNKYDGSEIIGDVMLVHCCKGCGEININRIAGDDYDLAIINVFERSLSLDQDKRETLAKMGIRTLQAEDRASLECALYGKPLQPDEPDDTIPPPSV